MLDTGCWILDAGYWIYTGVNPILWLWITMSGLCFECRMKQRFKLYLSIYLLATGGTYEMEYTFPERT
jgi:hypothetical protein